MNVMQIAGRNNSKQMIDQAEMTFELESMPISAVYKLLQAHPVTVAETSA